MRAAAVAATSRMHIRDGTELIDVPLVTNDAVGACVEPGGLLPPLVVITVTAASVVEGADVITATALGSKEEGGIALSQPQRLAN